MGAGEGRKKRKKKGMLHINLRMRGARVRFDKGKCLSKLSLSSSIIRNVDLISFAISTLKFQLLQRASIIGPTYYIPNQLAPTVHLLQFPGPASK